MGTLLAGASPALAQGGWDVLTLRGQGSSIGVEFKVAVPAAGSFR